MALNGAERAKRYRERKKESNVTVYRHMEAKHKAKYRAKLKESKDKWTAYLRKDRQRKQEKKHCDSNQLALKLPAFTSSQSLMRSLKRANSALPKSSPQKVAILGAMVADLSSSKMSTVMDSARRKVEDKRGRTKALTEEQQKCIISFLQRPDISYTCPGRKDQVYVGKTKDGDKDYRTKYYLLWKLSEILSLFKQVSSF